MECDPTLSEDLVQVARPLLRATLPQLAMAVSPSLKVTFPVGVSEPGLFAVTVAVNFTDCPNTDGFNEELTDVVVPYFTVCVGLGDVLPLEFASPPDDAVVEGGAAAGVVVANVPWPGPSRVPGAGMVGPS